MISTQLKRREFLKIAGAALPGAIGLAGGFFNCSRNQPGQHPNIVYIVADDLGYGDVRCLNTQSKIPTSNLDKLAAEGITFTDAHSGSAVCTPTRYGILTGRYCWRSPLKSGVLWGYSPPLIEPERMTVASFLRQHGYKTGCVGKWHLGLNWRLEDGRLISEKQPDEKFAIDYSQPIQGGPNDVGFDYFFGIPASLDMIPYVYIENNQVVAPPTETIEGTSGYEFYREGPIAPGFSHEEVLPFCTQKAVEFIDNCALNDPQKPFFLYFPLSAPHTPILPTKEFQGKSGIGVYGDFVVQCDWSVGQIMATLEKHDMAENTLVIFTSDNGCSPMANFEDLAEKIHFPSYHFRGHKADIFEGGHRIPFIVRWQNKIKAKSTCDDTICLTDLLVTVAAIIGEKLPDNAGEDSVSILPDLLGTANEPTREATVHHSINGSFSIRQGKWKLELCPGSGGWSFPTPAKAKELGLPGIQLYDLSKDVGEKINVQDKHPEVVARLTKLLQKYVDMGRSTPGKPQQNDGEVNIWKS